MKKLLTIAIVALLISSCTNDYSQGQRVGIITKFSNKGLAWKSWEGELKIAPNIVNGGMIGNYETFAFSIDNDGTVSSQTRTDSIAQFSKEGVPVVITYQECWGLNWFRNRGETSYFVKSIERTK
jgi:hypothetical protein